MNKIAAYILPRWDLTVRFHQCDEGDTIGLPKPYTVPCVNDAFQNLYYWDTYFANIGLIASGKTEQAKNNVDNFIYEIEKFGFIPNANHPAMLDRSQPPYLAMMVRDVYDEIKDDAWLLKAYGAIKKEYAFWMEQRSLDGFNRYFHNHGPAQSGALIGFYDAIAGRLGLDKNIADEKKEETGAHLLAEAESGWDFNPRFEMRCADFAPVDLNAQLAIYEQIMAEFSDILKTGEVSVWENRFVLRKEQIRKCFWDGEKGFFFDYDIKEKRLGKIRCLAGFYPMWAGVATEEQAAMCVKNMRHLEYPFGMAQCEKNAGSITYQWDYPNGWPPSQYVCVHALLRYGYEVQAKAVAARYVEAVTSCFGQTGDLWEKYDVTTGMVPTANEYQPPAMMGWTAGVFMDFLKILE